MRMGRCVAIVLLVLPLAGCFVSDEALIDGNRAAYPLPQTAAVESYSWDSDNKIWKHAHYHTLARAGIGYRLVDDTGEALNFVLMELNSSTWLVEEGKPDDSSTFNYALLTRNDKGQYVVRDLDDACDSLIAHPSVAASYGIRVGDTDCTLSSIAQLRSFVANNMDDVLDEDPSSIYVIR